ncbi:hypothetical protein HFO50_12265 [Rhizobium leguminosarum]|uniref:hypothetical protein n=1 Tax=Rhizobium leguminosarum TaxID=384 RepID=UPI001C9552F5|nr:hypothetical protein [Rhizobium leguminosarum]MBY5601943.1 hypothetical protein [Rhizobium leguminosarum]
MAERMSERAKGDIDAILERLYRVSPELDRIAAECERALRLNAEARGDYISPRTMQAFAEMRDAVSALYGAAQNAMKEADRFFKPKS